LRIEKLSAMAELVSSIAIVATLIYLSVQTQQNTNALLAVSRQALLEADMDLLNSAMDYPLDYSSVDSTDRAPAEESRLQSQLIKTLRVREFAWFQRQTGILDEETWQSYLAPMANMFQSERAREYLDLYYGNPEFKAYLIRWLEEDSP